MDKNQTTTDKITHFFTLHFSRGEKTTSFRVTKHHAIGVCAIAVTIMIGSMFCLHSYYSTKAELAVSARQLEKVTKDKRILEEKTKRLESENAEYQENITQIENKAATIENKLTEIESVKEDLRNKLNTISEENTSASAACNTMAASIQDVPAQTPAFTTIVRTAYSKVSSLSTELERLDQQLDTTGVAFIDVADNVTETLSAISSTPVGYPCSGRITTTFNPNGDPSISDGRVHKGLDIATSYNTPVTATANGTVTEATFSPSYGYYVKISHGDGYETLYAHDASLNCSVGDEVKKGDIIAFAGSTGNSSGVHVHYEILLNNVHQDPEDFKE